MPILFEKEKNHMLDILYNLHSQVLEGVNEDLDLLSGHLLWLESRAKGNKDSSLLKGQHYDHHITGHWKISTSQQKGE